MKSPAVRFSFIEKFISGEVNFGFWTLINRAIKMANTFLIVSSLSIFQYGLLQLLLSVFNLISDFLSFAGAGGVISIDIMRFRGEGREDKAKRLFLEQNGLQFFLGILVWAILFFGAPIFSFNSNNESFLNYLPLISFLFLLEPATSISKSLLNINLNFRAAASRPVIARIMQFIILLYFMIFSDLGIKEVVISMIGGSAFAVLALLTPVISAARIWKGIKCYPKFLTLGIILAHGKWAIIQQYISDTYKNIAPFLIKFFINTEAVGIFSIAQSMVSLVIDFVPLNVFKSLISLRITEKENLRKAYIYGSKYLLFLSVIFGLGAAIFGPIAIMLLFPQYKVSLPYFHLLLFYMPLLVQGSLASAFLFVFRKQKFLAFQKLLKIIVGFPLFFVLLPLFGLWGMVIHVIVLSIILLLSMLFYLYKIRPEFKPVWRDYISFTREDKYVFSRIWAYICGSILKKIGIATK
jgi:O-antigen/teichoic acid export membrane protein